MVATSAVVLFDESSCGFLSLVSNYLLPSRQSNHRTQLSRCPNTLRSLSASAVAYSVEAEVSIRTSLRGSQLCCARGGGVIKKSGMMVIHSPSHLEELNRVIEY